MEFSSGFLLSLSLCLDIGIANIAMITLAMQRGYFQGFALGLGTCVGDLVYAVLALAGMTVLLQYEAVRWVLWIGGSVLLLYFAAKMVHSAIYHGAVLEQAGEMQGNSSGQEFLRGIFLAMSSPSAILWFAAVGGTLIARSGGARCSARSCFSVASSAPGCCGAPACAWRRPRAENYWGINCCVIPIGHPLRSSVISLFT
ncbi:LysE type translocator [Pseudomonas sp. SJZ101]|nr:LysE type translocator [Pseudomonas sp. SJZ075]TWC25453.1 LysE type translocator [Pseudomonas sp. SJZ078]TWC44842.1 LysE type translocator [Pseudomonas sp. SJZ124]TWC80360.1 LysE type translocator [Pseudomonas sp. SJZ101]